MQPVSFTYITRGEIHDAFSAELQKLNAAIEKVKGHNVEDDWKTFENPTFAMRPYIEPECDCGAAIGISDDDPDWYRLIEEAPHLPTCKEITRINFHHKPTGFMIRWYKRMGRQMDWSTPITPEAFADLVHGCARSLFIEEKTPC